MSTNRGDDKIYPRENSLFKLFTRASFSSLMLAPHDKEQSVLNDFKLRDYLLIQVKLHLKVRNPFLLYAVHQALEAVAPLHHRSCKFHAEIYFVLGNQHVKVAL